MNSSAPDCYWWLKRLDDGYVGPSAKLRAVQFLSIPAPTKGDFVVIRSGGSIVISWQTLPFTGYVLQYSPNVNGPWATYNGSTVTVDYVRSATFPASGRMFYRMKK
jgi:hypothetical protein